ncbi:XPG domain containing-domain-containing protein [Aspergillus crustosus]
MVPTVLEDLEYRWNKDYTARITEGILPVLDSRSPAWAKLSTIVPGEADAYCAYAARLTGCCILTNDSDLLLYDLGDNGSVVFLDSIELSVWDSGQPLQSQMKATMLRPSETAERLRISSLLPLAYELQTHPELGLVDLLRRSRSLTTMPGPSEYQQFVAEYQINNNEQDIVERPLALFDTRISELCYQYQPTCEGACTRAGNYPHMYLPILIEDHSRRCAWVNGHLYRKAAYSLLNVARPYSERHCYVTEFIRRGQRIVEDRTQLCDEGWISAQLKSLSVRLASLRADLGADNGSLEYWTIFALYEVYSAGIRFDHHHIPRLQRFISLGYMGRRLEWADIHLTAQTHAVLYSLRILKQLLSFSSPDDAIALHVKKTLESLPPLHVITKPIYQRGKQCTADISATRLSGIFEFAMVSGRSEHTEETTRHELHPHCSATARTVQGGANDDARPLKNLSNIFELLQEQ